MTVTLATETVEFIVEYTYGPGSSSYGSQITWSTLSGGYSTEAEARTAATADIHRPRDAHWGLPRLYRISRLEKHTRLIGEWTPDQLLAPEATDD